MKKAIPAWALLIILLVSLAVPTLSFATEDGEEAPPAADNAAYYDDVLPLSMESAYVADDYQFDASETAAYESFVLFNPDTGDILYESDADDTFLCTGSIAMLMTLRLALSNLNPNEYIRLSKDQLDSAFLQETESLYAGRSVRIVELAALMLLYESRQAAYILSELIARKLEPSADTAARCREVMLEAMNEEAARLNMTNTVYVNTTGGRDTRQVTTARDTIRLMYSIYLIEEDTLPIGNTDYLVGCLAQGGLIGTMSENDPRNVSSYCYDPDILGYACNETDDRQVMAFSRRSAWKYTSRGTFDGAIFSVAVTKTAETEQILTVMKRASSQFGMLNADKMLTIVLQNKPCPNCTGTFSDHKISCSYPVRELQIHEGRTETGRRRYMKATEIDTMTTLEKYDTYSMSHITADFVESEIRDGHVYAEGEPFATLQIYFDGLPFLRVQTYTVVGKSAQNQEPIATAPPVEDETEEKPDTLKGWLDGIAWQTWVLLGVGIPILVLSIALTVHANRKLREM